MKTIFIELGVFCISLIFAVFFQTFPYRKKSRDCLLFGRLLLSTAAILAVDTIGWVIDGSPILGQVWITTIVDGLDLFITSLVCWCWVQYALYIARGKKSILKEWYKDLSNWLLILQAVLVSSSQIFGFYYSVDDAGFYHRGDGYIMHSLISLAILAYSSFVCIKAFLEEQNAEKKKELLFVAWIILIPILGNIFQFFVYGYPTVWLCMCFMFFTVYVHIQNKRVNAEKAKQDMKLQSALEEAQVANSAKTSFLSRMSHDMRTPMNAILGITSLLQDRTDPEEIKNDVQQIEKSGKYLLSLINDTLDMNKIESGKLELHNEPVNSKDLFANVIATSMLFAKQNDVKLITDIPDIEHGNWVPVVADACRVEQIFMNIITNAVKFTPKGGSVTVRLENLSIDENTITDKYTISDTGIGMSKEFQAHVFEPFAQEERANTDRESGTGLGLSIVKNIIELMGGTIELESEINKGTTFTLILTYERYHGNIDVKPKEEIDLSILNGKRVLLCEDHPINAQIAIRLLEKQGVTVEHAENGQVGVDMVAKANENYYDAILMDIRMPIMDGITAAKEIRTLPNSYTKTIPIIAMTANAYDADIESTLNAGMNAHLAKPVSPEMLYSTLAYHLKNVNAFEKAK